MKKKVVLALVAALTLTVGSLGTVFAMHDHVWSEEQWIVDKEEVRGDKWVVDKEAVYETVHHPAETHEEEQWVVDKEAWTETIEHPAETHEEQQWVVDQEAWDEQVIVGYHSVCNECGNEYDYEHYLKYGCKSTSYTSNVPIYDTIHHPEEGHWETVIIVDKEAWTETIEHPEEGHWETVTVVDKEAWDEEVLVSPEEGHWEYDVILIPESGHWEHTCTECGEVQNSKTGEVIKPGETTEPEEPGTDDPATEEPENPDADSSTGNQTETPSTDDSQTTDQNDQETEDSGKQETTETDEAQNSNNASSTTEEKDATASTVSDENEIPKTGDPSSLISLITLAGSAVTGGTAFGLRRKFKK